MTKMNEFLRKVCAMALTVILTVMPITPLSFAEESTLAPLASEQVEQEPTKEPTQEPTKEPAATPTEAPTAEPTATPAEIPTATPAVVPSAQPSVEPSAQPSVEPSVEPSAQPSVEPSVEPSTEPDLSLMDALPLAVANISSETSKVTLFGDGDTYTWSVKKAEGYKGSVNYYLDAADSAFLIIDTSGNLRTKSVSDVKTVTIHAQDTEKATTLNCVVTILPLPTYFKFKSDYKGPVNISANGARYGYDGEYYSFKEVMEKGASVPRYELRLGAGVTGDISDYERFITFSSSKPSAIPIESAEGTLKNEENQYTELPLNADITMSLKSEGSKELTDKVQLTIYNNPHSISVEDKISIPVGGLHNLQYTLKDKEGNVLKLDGSAVKITADDEDFITVDGTKIIGKAKGRTTVSVKLQGTEVVSPAYCTVDVQDVPVDEDLQLRNASNLIVWDSAYEADASLALSKGETLELTLDCLKNGGSKYIGQVTAASDNAEFVTASASQADGKIKITLKGLKVTPNNTTPLPTVTISVNSDLTAVEGEEHTAKLTVPVRVLTQPVELILNKETYNLCAGDSFMLIAIPLPKGETASRYTIAVEQRGKYVEVKEIAPPAGDAYPAEYGYFTVKGMNVGSAVITIASTSASKPSAKCTVTVGGTPTSLALPEASVTMAVDAKYQLEPMLRDNAGVKYGGAFKFVSNDPDIVEVDSNSGLLQAKSTGTTNVIVSSVVFPDIAGSFVKVEVVKANEITLKFDKGNYDMMLGASIVVAPSFSPKNTRVNLVYSLTKSTGGAATSDAVRMTAAEDTQSVTLKASSSVTGVYILKVRTDGLAEEREATCNITVGLRPTSIAPAGDYIRVGVNEIIRPGYALKPSGAVTQGVYYTIEPTMAQDLSYFNPETNMYEQRMMGAAETDDQPTVPVNSGDANYSGTNVPSTSGLYTGTYIKGVKAGFVRVSMRTIGSARNAGIYKQWVIEVVDEPAKIVMDNQRNVTLLSGMKLSDHKARAVAKNGDSIANCKITYSSSDESIATVDPNGVVTAMLTATGEVKEATITASIYAGNPSSVGYQVKVINAPETIHLNGTTDNIKDRYYAEIGVGEEFTIIPSFDGTTQGIEPPLAYTIQDTKSLSKLEASAPQFKVKGVKDGENKLVKVVAPNGTNADMSFTVLKKPTSIKFRQTKSPIGLGENYPLDILVYQGKALAGNETRKLLKYTLTSSDPGIATVDDNGIVHVSELPAYLDKTFTVKAESICGGVTATSCTFTVLAKPTGIYIDQTYPSVRQNIQTIGLVQGETKDSKVVKVKARFAPESGYGAVDYFKNIKVDGGSISYTNDEKTTEFKDAFLYVYTELDKDGAYVLCMKPINNKTGTVEFQPTAYSAYTSLTVKVQAAAELADVEIIDKVTLAAGMTYQIVPKLLTDKGANFEYIAGGTELTVDRTLGLVSAKKKGTVPVLIKWKSRTKTLEKRVQFNIMGAPSKFLFAKYVPVAPDETPKEIAVSGLQQISVKLYKGESYIFRYYFDPVDTMSDDVTLEPLLESQKNVSYKVTLDEDGLGGTVKVTGNDLSDKPILFKLTSTVGTSVKTANFSVTVGSPPTALSITPETLRVLPGQAYTMKTTVAPSAAGGSIYYTYEMLDGADDCIASFNTVTGAFKIKDEVSAACKLNIVAHSTARAEDEEEDCFKGRNICVVTVLGSLLRADIEENLYYTGTETLYTSKEIALKNMCVGDVIKLSFVVPKDPLPDYSADSKVIFSIEKNSESILSVKSTGEITAKQAGSAKVKVSPAGSIGSEQTVILNFNVVGAPTSITYACKDDATRTLFQKGLLKFNAGEKYNLTTLYGLKTVVMPTEVEDTAIVNATTSSAKIATIARNEHGEWELTTLGKGTVTITFSTSNGRLKTSFKVNVYQLPDYVSISPKKITLGVGMQQTVKASYGPSGRYTDSPILLEAEGWQNPGAASAAKDLTDITGMKFIITGESAGQEYFIAKSEDPRIEGFSQINVEVLDGPAALEVTDITDFTNEGDQYTLSVGETSTLRYSVQAPTGGFSKMLTQYIYLQKRDKDGGSVKWSTATYRGQVDDKRYYDVKVTGVTAGEASFIIKASNTADGDEITVPITVKDALTKVIINVPSTTIYLAPDETYSFGFEGQSAGLNLKENDSFAATSSNEKAVYISAFDSDAKTAEVTAADGVLKGSATIKITGRNYKGGAVSASVKFVVSDVVNGPSTKLSVSCSPTTFNEGTRGKVNVSISKGVGTGVVFSALTQDSNGDWNVDADTVLGLDTETGVICPEPGSGLGGNKGAAIKYRVIATLDGSTIESKPITISVRPGPAPEGGTGTTLTTTIDDDEIEIGKGESVSFKYKPAAGEKYSTTFKYASNDPTVATVSSSGSIKGIMGKMDENGTYDFANIIMNALNGNDAKVKVTVKNAPLAVRFDDSSRNKNTKNEIELDIGDTLQLSSGVQFLDARGAVDAKSFASYKMSYSSSSSKVAKVVLDASSGSYCVEALKAGSASITIRTFNGKTCKILIRVLKQP